MNVHITTIDPLELNGDLSCPIGTRPWCIAARIRIQELLERHETSHESIDALISQVVETSAWKQLTKRDGKPFASYTEFCTTRKPHGLGRSDEEIKKIIADGKAKSLQELVANPPPLAGHGINQHNERHEGVDIVKSSEHGGNSSTYLIARLARDQPELLEQIGPDKPYKSARAAAIAAGIVKVPTPLEQGKKVFTQMDEEARREFFSWILNFKDSPCLAPPNG